MTDAAFAVPSGGAGAQAFMGQPAFTGGRSGLMSVDLQVDTASAVWVYGTSDLGASWTPLSRVPAGFTEVAFLDGRHWLSADGPELAQTACTRPTTAADPGCSSSRRRSGTDGTRWRSQGRESAISVQHHLANPRSKVGATTTAQLV